MIQRVAFLVLGALSLAACYEGGPFGQPVRTDGEVRAAVARADLERERTRGEVGALQRALLDEQRANDAIQRQLLTQMEQLSEANLALRDRIAALEDARAASPSMDALAGEQDAQIAKELERLARRLASNAASNRSASRGVALDDHDPSAFGPRK